MNRVKETVIRLFPELTSEQISIIASLIMFDQYIHYSIEEIQFAMKCCQQEKLDEEVILNNLEGLNDVIVRINNTEKYKLTDSFKKRFEEAY